MQDARLPIDADGLRRTQRIFGGDNPMSQGNEAFNGVLRYRLLNFKGITTSKEARLVNCLLE